MSYFAPNLPSDKHCFFGRRNGCSEGLYASLNCSLKSNDNTENVKKNLGLVAAHYQLKPENLMLINQGISGHAEFTKTASHHQVTADGIVTDRKGIILCIGTADCTPVLFYDEKNQIIGAAHAGWRGALRGIAENTLEVMLKHGAEIDAIHAATGPCLQQPSFEAGTDMYEEFVKAAPNNEQWFASGKDKDHYQFDMEGFVIAKLKACGIKNITASGIDTYAKEEDYFSFRRNTHQGLVKVPKDFPVHLSTVTL